MKLTKEELINLCDELNSILKRKSELVKILAEHNATQFLEESYPNILRQLVFDKIQQEANEDFDIEIDLDEV